MEIKSTSKINIGLHVHNKRSDGFHNISTLFQEIDLCDTIKMIEDKNFHAQQIVVLLWRKIILEQKHLI